MKSTKPAYLKIMRVFATINGGFGILALLFFIFAFTNALIPSSTVTGANYSWVIALAIAIQGLITYRFLNAVADITENIVDVGNFAREIQAQNKML